MFSDCISLYPVLGFSRIPQKIISFPSNSSTNKKKFAKKKIYPCDVLSAQPSSTIDTLNCWMCIFLLLLPSLPSLVLIFVICFIWGIVSFFSRFCGNIFFVFSFIVDTFAFFSRGFVFVFFFSLFFLLIIVSFAPYHSRQKGSMA